MLCHSLIWPIGSFVALILLGEGVFSVRVVLLFKEFGNCIYFRQIMYICILYFDSIAVNSF